MFNKVEYLQKELKSLIEAYKENYYSRISKRMMNPLTSTKTYLFEFFIANELISSNQSGFKPDDYCKKQLLFITHKIYRSFDDGYKVRGVFHDISKAFDKVWQNGLIYKLKQNEVSSDLLNLIIDFLDARKQRFVLNGQYSSWASVKAGDPQGSILGLLFFLNIY